MKTKKDYYVGVEYVKRITGYANAKGYRVIKALNAELSAKGIMTIHGYTPRKYFLRRFGLENPSSSSDDGERE